MFSLMRKFHTLNFKQKITMLLFEHKTKREIAGDYNFKYYLIWTQYFDRFMYCKHIKKI